MSNPFDYVNTILVSKTNMMRNTENDSLAEKEYNPWLTATALSYYDDTILIANLVNSLHHLPNRAQYEVLIKTVRPRKRKFQKWVKTVNNEDLELVCAVYQCNRTHGKEYLALLSAQQIEMLRKQHQKGGTKQ